MDSDERLKERDLDGLRAVLNEWDPIGVYRAPAAAESAMPEWSIDEYDCLRWPLVSRLRDGASRMELADFLQDELTHHFGLAGESSDDDPVLNRLQTWWGSKGVS